MAEFFEQIWYFISSFLSVLPEFWNFRITTVDQSAVTIGNIVEGLTLFFLGYFVCIRLSRKLEKKLADNFNIEPSLLHNLTNIIFYILLVFLILFVLRFINIPLGALTFVGGALAVGFGLGSQNIVKNFISGFVIMLERTIKIGDIVEVDGFKGTVEQIGARGTKIKTIDNSHIIVPNSAFLEKNLLNWTLQDNVVKGQVSLGVSYDSDVKKVEKLIKQATCEVEQVLPHPEPKVLFKDLADSTLNFCVYFWAKLPHPLLLEEIESSIRFRVIDLFREEKIVIAFPQRDIHMDVVKPIPIHVLENLHASKEQAPPPKKNTPSPTKEKRD